MLGKFRQRAQEHLHILHVAHAALIIVHLLVSGFGEILQDRMHDLDHIPELLERDPEAMNGRRVLRLHLTERLPRPRIRLIHRG